MRQILVSTAIMDFAVLSMALSMFTGPVEKLRYFFRGKKNSVLLWRAIRVFTIRLGVLLIVCGGEK